MKRRFLCYGGILLLWGLDQWSKQGIAQVDHGVFVINSWLNLILRYNSGIAFGIGSQTSALFIWLTLTISLVSLALLIWIWQCPHWKTSQALALTGITAGALGNLQDRLIYGQVLDFIDFHIGSWHFATFNLADTWICLGTLLLLVVGVPSRRSSQSQ